MAIKKLFIAGFGGQGVMVMGQMIAKAAMMEGKEVTYLPSYGPEMRGGTANCSIVVSDKKISCPLIAEPTDMVVMNLPSLIKFEDILLPKGKLFINTSLIAQESKRTDVDICKVDATSIAKHELENEKTANMVMLGAIVRETGIVELESIEKVMEKMFTGKKAAMLPLNQKALRAWEA